MNLGNPIEFTVKDLANKVLNNVKSSSKITYEPLPVDDPQRRKPDISRAKKILDWEPMVDLDTGLNLTIKWFNNL